MSLDDRARSIFTYMKKYNYAITETGEVINFQGMYKASKARAAALVTYVFFGAPDGRVCVAAWARPSPDTVVGACNSGCRELPPLRIAQHLRPLAPLHHLI